MTIVLAWSIFGVLAYTATATSDEGNDRCQMSNDRGDKNEDCKQINIPNPPSLPGHRPQGMHALTVNEARPEPFTKQDVINYFRTHNLPKNSSSPTQFQVETLEFLTNKEVSQRLGRASPAQATNEKVGFATLSGTFFFTGPPGAYVVRYSRAYAVFDSRTGNLVMFGTLDQGQRVVSPG
jgi:hypothetical protein